MTLKPSPSSPQPNRWQKVIAEHPLESADPEAWLLYGQALLLTITPGAEAARQQQQAALAFVKAREHGASEAAVEKMQRQALNLTLRQLHRVVSSGTVTS
jgi:hypothetical protein